MSPGFKRSRADATYNSDGYGAQFLYNGESCLVIGSTVQPGTSGPAHHLHEHSDQVYFVTDGEIKIQLGSEVFTAGQETLVFIPKGTPHHNFNDGTVQEFHFEVLSPVPDVTQAIATPTDSTDAGGRPFRVVPAAGVAVEEPMEGMKVQRLLGIGDASEHMTINLMEIAPGSGGPPTHVHEFDQLFYILDGEMTVEAALQTFTAVPGDLVVLPAGVPHTQYNEGSVPERHIALLTPSPSPGEPWDVGVTLTATGASY
ncbi:MAG TPA: cupin domain-containing protein [Baekduia sp.]|nr:cupin domain-containing protein [Baekduia sp.]